MIIAMLAAGVTAFYMFRLVVLTFYGKPRYDVQHIHPHESPSTMTIPLIILAVLSAIGGFIGVPEFSECLHILKTGWNRFLLNLM